MQHSWGVLQEKALLQASFERNLGIAAGVSFGIGAVIPISSYYKISLSHSLLCATLSEIAIGALVLASYWKKPEGWDENNHLTQCYAKEKGYLELVPDAIDSLSPTCAYSLCSEEEFEVASDKVTDAKKWCEFGRVATFISTISFVLFPLVGFYRFIWGDKRWDHLAGVVLGSSLAIWIGTYSLYRRWEESALRYDKFTQSAAGSAVYNAIFSSGKFRFDKALIEAAAKVEFPTLNDQQLLTLAGELLTHKIPAQDRRITICDGRYLTEKGIIKAYAKYPLSGHREKLVIKWASFKGEKNIRFSEWIVLGEKVQIWRGFRQPT